MRGPEVQPGGAPKAIRRPRPAQQWAKQRKCQAPSLGGEQETGNTGLGVCGPQKLCWWGVSSPECPRTAEDARAPATGMRSVSDPLPLCQEAEAAPAM